jgi:hypothetical protein
MARSSRDAAGNPDMIQRGQEQQLRAELEEMLRKSEDKVQCLERRGVICLEYEEREVALNSELRQLETNFSELEQATHIKARQAYENFRHTWGERIRTEWKEEMSKITNRWKSETASAEKRHVVLEEELSVSEREGRTCKNKRLILEGELSEAKTKNKQSELAICEWRELLQTKDMSERAMLNVLEERSLAEIKNLCAKIDNTEESLMLANSRAKKLEGQSQTEMQVLECAEMAAKLEETEDRLKQHESRARIYLKDSSSSAKKMAELTSNLALKESELAVHVSEGIVHRKSIEEWKMLASNEEARMRSSDRRNNELVNATERKMAEMREKMNDTEIMAKGHRDEMSCAHDNVMKLRAGLGRSANADCDLRKKGLRTLLR